jgi:ketosteroid isomerase-like protein
MTVSHQPEQTELDLEAALTNFDTARDGYVAAMRALPGDALAYLRPGDDYTLGGLAVHVSYVLEHYVNVLDELAAAGSGECHPEDPEGLEQRALDRAKSELPSDQVEVELAATERLHVRVRGTLAGLGDGCVTKAPVWYPGADAAYPTSPADVLDWLTGHYLEHVPHIGSLLDEWRAGGAAAPRAVVDRFNEAFGRGDVDGVMALMTDDCVFENTYPPPDGERHAGRTAVRTFWERFFGSTDRPRFETEEIFAADDRVVARWRFSWGDPDGGGHVRGVDVFRVRDGKVAEKLSYVKG